MNEHLQKDIEALDSLLEATKEQAVSYLNTIATRPTSVNRKVEINLTLSENGLGTMQTLQQFNNRFEPIMVASSGPRYWGYVTGGSTPASIVGDWLTSVYDQNAAHETQGHGSISAIIELETIQLLLSLFELPKDFLGGFVTGATLSNFTCLAVARQWVGKQLGKDFAKEGVSEKLKVLSATPHSSSVKSLSMLGIGSNNLILVKTGDNREAINIAELEKKIIEMNGYPFILISSAGTVNTVDFDDLVAIAALKEKYNFWWHVDAAFGGFAACSSSHKHLVKGWETADSITVDCHKWMNVPFESGVFFVKEKYKLLQVETFQNSNAPYLGDPLEKFSYLNFLPENSRRLKTLPAWFTLNAYGKEGYKQIVEGCSVLANQFGDFIIENHSFELLAPVRLNTVCFTLKDEEKVIPFLSQLNDTGKVFMTATVYSGRKGIRAAFVNGMTTENDLLITTKLMTTIIDELK